MVEIKIVEYILSCIIGCFDSYAGRITTDGIKEGFIGLTSLLFIILLFFASFVFFDRRINIDFKTNIWLSIGVVILLIGLIFLILIIAEKIF